MAALLVLPAKPVQVTAGLENLKLRRVDWWKYAMMSAMLLVPDAGVLHSGCELQTGLDGSLLKALQVSAVGPALQL